MTLRWGTLVRWLLAATLTAVAATATMATMAVTMAVTMAGVVATPPAPVPVVTRAAAPSRLRRAAPAPHPLSGQASRVALDGRGVVRVRHDPNAVLTLTLGLGVRHAAELDALIAAAADPSSLQYGRHLTNARYLARYAPTGQEVRAVETWARRSGLTVRGVTPENLLITVQGTTRRVERAFGVRLDDATRSRHVTMATDHAVAVPPGLDIRAVSGLAATSVRLASPRRAHAHAADPRYGCCYFPADFQTAYDVGPIADASNQTIGLILWGAPVAQSDLDQYAADTGTTPLVNGQAGADGVDWIPVSGASADTTDLHEAALDVETVHAMAPHSHLKVWLARDASDDTGIELAINAAAHDPGVHIVSNSWSDPEAAGASDPFVYNTTVSFQYAAAVGTTFYFPSGDDGYASGTGCQPALTPTDCTAAAPSYPPDSPYVVGVGGTTLATTAGYGYGSETVWPGSGGGCSRVFARPAWQIGADAASCAGRAVPDVAADADIHTGAYAYVEGHGFAEGGTSVAAPLWAGMAADIDHYLAAHHRPPMGFAAPRLYQLARDATTYKQDFHDVTAGVDDPSPGGVDRAYAYAAGPGWDQATGWGSPNLANLAADWSGDAPPPVPASPPAVVTRRPAGQDTATPTPATMAARPASTPAPGAHSSHPASLVLAARARRAALLVSLAVPRRIMGGRDMIVVGVHTSPRTSIVIAMCLTRPREGAGGAGMIRSDGQRHTATAVTLYQQTVRAWTDRHGLLTRQLRLAYATEPMRAPIRGTLSVTVRTPQRTITRSATVSIAPSS